MKGHTDTILGYGCFKPKNYAETIIETLTQTSFSCVEEKDTGSMIPKAIKVSWSEKNSNVMNVITENLSKYGGVDAKTLETLHQEAISHLKKAAKNGKRLAEYKIVTCNLPNTVNLYSLDLQIQHSLRKEGLNACVTVLDYYDNIRISW